MLECVTRIQFQDVIISDWGLESNWVEMKRQYAKLVESCDTQAQDVKLLNATIDDETIGTSSDPTSYASPFGSNYIKWRGAQGSEQQLQLNYHRACKFVIWQHATINYLQC